MVESKQQETVAYWNGQLVPTESLAVPVFDAGFIQGLTVAEQLRTFGGKIFRIEDHLKRLLRSLEIVGVDPGLSQSQFADIVNDMVRRNHSLLTDGDDIGVALWVTPGPYKKFEAITRPGPNVCCHTHPLDFHSWVDQYETGVRLVTSKIRQVSTENWPAELKCRSRMHYFLADKEAREKDPHARALLLDLEGFVCEASTANILAYIDGEGLVAPKQEKILPGISMSVLRELATGLGIPFVNRDITPDQFAAANEILLCSTSPCVLPVLHLDGRPVSDGKPGTVYKQLLAAWSELVGISIVEQSRSFAGRRLS
jgi:branched-subunit amino acid aminotransferase/4-amino-4-deoxychorismate lyase